MLGFHHEIYNALIHDNPVFNSDSRIYQQPESPEALIRCELITSEDLDRAASYFYQVWYAELRYENPVLEILDLSRRRTDAAIHALTISAHNAMTFLFTIQRGISHESI